MISISSITLAEIVYLVEKGRIAPATLQLVLTEFNTATGIFSETPVNQHIIVAMGTISRADIPDLPDRLIAATAVHLNVPIISRDGKIQTSGLMTIW